MNPNFAQKLGFYIRKINIGAQNIDGFIFKIFEMIIADFHVENKIKRLRFFQKTFLMANTKFRIFLGMFFVKISNGNMSFSEKIPI